MGVGGYLRARISISVGSDIQAVNSLRETNNNWYIVTQGCVLSDRSHKCIYQY